jgi:hypothetical protein
MGRENPVKYMADAEPEETPGAVLQRSSGKSVIVTCSSFMSRGNRRQELLAAVSSILTRHPPAEQQLIGELIVINEYDSVRSEDYAPAVRALSPKIEFIQKGPAERGQARTLNMILDRIGGYEYWVHWEESFVCTRPFLARAVDVMLSTELTQLQLTPDWLDVGMDRLRPEETAAGTRYVRVLPHTRTAELVRTTDVFGYDRLVNRNGWGVAWPPFSLRPGINRVDFCGRVGRFSEDPRLWPVRFEWEYAKRWLMAGATKAVLSAHAAERQPNHLSTYKEPHERRR